MRKLKSFSLIEVLMSFLILSVALVALSPIITKKFSMKTKKYTVFSYYDTNNTKTKDVCFQTSTASGSTSETYTPTDKCSEYEFTVPNSVEKLDLTLVAGGGGGGGAAGGKNASGSVRVKGFDTSDGGTAISQSSFDTIYPDMTKSLTIDYLSTNGGAGQAFSNKSCLYGSNLCGSASGQSSPAIVKFDLPRDLIGGFAFKRKINADPRLRVTVSDNGSRKYSLEMRMMDSSTQPITYYIDGSFNIGCTIGDTTYEESNEGRTGDFFTKCRIPQRNYRQSYGIEFGDFLNKQIWNGYQYNTNYAYDGLVLYGGAPKPNDAQRLGYGSCGMGGNGASGVVSCPGGGSCAVSSASISQYSQHTAGNGGCAYVSWVTESPGGGGGGGAGGAMVKIRGLKVTPGETYTVRVGAGGTGGGGGYTSTSPTAGSDGTGGVSTAIYDKDGNLVYMVNGGSQGHGGSVAPYDEGYGAIGASGRITPKLFTSSTYSSTVPVLDTTYVTYVNNTSSYDTNSTGAPSAVASATKILNYPIYEKQPYEQLDRNGASSKSSSDYTHGGYSGYVRNNFNLTISSYYVAWVGTQGATDISMWQSNNNRASGLYFAKLIDSGRTLAYLGGLGGFTGFGERAGCGGYFNGDEFGCAGGNVGDDTCDSHYKQSFYTGTTWSDTRLFRVPDYFENCVFDEHNNGATASYVTPNPLKGEYGSGGTGGGGGGYSIRLGAGKGGDGQNGFAVIEWYE